MHDLSVAIPSFQENPEILKKLKSEFESLGAEVIIVDDGSKEPYEDSIKHGSNFGYGAALMTAIKNSSRDIILTIDGDGQHTITEGVKLYHAFKLMQDVDMVVGVRSLKHESF